jgi:hypothetical protein
MAVALFIAGSRCVSLLALPSKLSYLYSNVRFQWH